MKKVPTLLLVLLCALSSYAQNYRYVNADKLNVRAEPNRESAVQVILFNTAEVELIEEYGDEWAKVEAYGYNGYVSSMYLVYEIGTRKGEPYCALPSTRQINRTSTVATHTAPAASPAVNTLSVYVCDSKSAYAYHSSTSCRGLNRCTHGVYKVSKSEAVNNYNRRACQICY